jgi:hypothetical protein
MAQFRRPCEPGLRYTASAYWIQAEFIVLFPRSRSSHRQVAVINREHHLARPYAITARMLRMQAGSIDAREKQ